MRIPSTLARLSVATIAVGALAAIAACDGGSDGDDNAPTSVTSPAAQATTGAGDATSIPVTYADAGATTFKVIGGKSDGALDVEEFMPADIRIRVGDTIEWSAHGFEGHTVTFGDGDDTLSGIGPYLIPNPDKADELIFSPTLSLPSAKQDTHDGTTEFINSGFFGVPVEQTYSLTFAEEGLFFYLCLVHPFTMTGTVSVEPADAQVPSAETVFALGEAEFERYTEELRSAAAEAGEPNTAPGAAETNVHYVNVGVITNHGQAAVYAPGAIDIGAGDTVIFVNDPRNFHNVIFKGNQELPPGIGIVPDPEGRGLNFSMARESAIAVDPPPEGFDDQTFVSSGSMGVTQPRITFTLRFDTPGDYLYACTIHTLAGMSGVIRVNER